MEDQTSRYSGRLRGLPPKSEGLTHSGRAGSLSLTRRFSRPLTAQSESLRPSNTNPLEEDNPPPCDNFDPPIVEDYYNEDESPQLGSETKTLLEEITDSLSRLSLRNPRSRNIIGSNMSGDLNTPPVGGTTFAGVNVIHPSSTSEMGSGTTFGSTSTTFHTPLGGPFSYGMSPISGPSYASRGSNSLFSHNTEGASSSNPFNNLP